ncbi:MAG: HsdM family class I SAM-dependent methyltransferase [bacterium]
MNDIQNLLSKAGCQQIENNIDIEIGDSKINFDAVGYINQKPVIGIDLKNNKGIGILSKLSNCDKIEFYGIVNQEKNETEWYQLIGGNITQLNKLPIINYEKGIEIEELVFWIEKVIESIHMNESISILEILIETAKIIVFKIESEIRSNKNDDINVLKEQLYSFIDDNNDLEDIKLRDKTLEEIFPILNDISLSSIEPQHILDAFDRVIFKTRNKSQGEFIIPEIITKITKTIFKKYINEIDNFFDGSSGIGQFLTMVKSVNEEVATYGMDYNQRIVNIAKLRSLIANQNSCIKLHDSLDFKDDKYENMPKKFDLIITSPSFGRRISNRDILNNYELADKATKSEALYIELYIKMLRAGAYLGTVVPEGLLTNSRDKNVREYILNKTILKAVISLPEGIYRPYTAIRTSILILKKKTTKNEIQEDVFMASPENIEELNKVIDELEDWEGLF